MHCNWKQHLKFLNITWNRDGRTKIDADYLKTTKFIQVRPHSSWNWHDIKTATTMTTATASQWKMMTDVWFKAT